MKRVLVTGSSGRIGRRLVKELVTRGFDVVGLDARAAPADQPGRSILGNLHDENTIAAAVGGVSSVVHLGALMSWLDADAARILQANVVGTFNLLRAAARSGVERFVFASTGEVYPESVPPAYLPIDEDHPTRPTSCYGMSKLVGEEMVRFFARSHGLPAAILRFEHTQDAIELLDPMSEFSGPRFFLQSKLRRERELGHDARVRILERLDAGREKLVVSRGEDGTPYRMMIGDSRDVVEGIRLALEDPRAIGQTFGIGPDEPISFDRAVPLMAHLTGLEVVDAVFPGPPVSYVTSNLKARSVLGFRPIWSFDAMLQEAAVRWSNTIRRSI